MSEWTVVLSSDDAKQVVLYNAKDRQLAVKSNASPFLSQVQLHDSQDPALCSLCKRPFASPYVYRNYFRVLAEAFASKKTIAEPAAKHSTKIPMAAMNTGYYGQFFIELGRVGRGGGGAVFGCEHVLNGTILGRYAVKKVPVGDDVDWLNRLLHEVHMLEAMRHPNVIEYRHAWLEEWQPSPFAPGVPHLFILMELAEEGSLEDVLSSGSHYSTEEELILLFKSLSLGLAHLHDRGILHRDLKPSNILLKRERQTGKVIPMISDFGEAGVASSSGSRTGGTGTIEYMAPELVKIDHTGRFVGRHSTSSDIWSLGMIFYKCLFNRLPFSNSIDDYELLHKELSELASINIPNEPVLTRPMKTLLRSMLSLDPDCRPSVKSILDILDAVKPCDRPSRAKMLPPSFSPVLLDRPPSHASVRSRRAISLDVKFFHYIPSLHLLVSYYRCYPASISPLFLLSDLAFIFIAYKYQSIWLTLFIGIVQSFSSVAFGRHLLCSIN